MRSISRAIRALLLTVVIGGVALGACLAALIPGTATLVASHHYTSDKLGNLKTLAQRSTIYDSQLNVVAQLGLENREDVQLKDVPKIIQDAVISVEDKTFWTNDGVDVNGVLRAALKNLTSGTIAQGGSTITQQLVKNRILTSKRDINRKIKEVVLAVRLNKKYSKKEILEQYLNTVYFGQGSYGVKAAVERFFLTCPPGLTGPTCAPFGPKALTLPEVTIGDAALLAGLISNPEGNNPFVNPAGARERRHLALGNMVTQRYITQAQADAADAEPLPAIKPVAELRPRNSWAEEVQDRLFHDPVFKVLGSTVKERRNKVLTGGLKIYASLDPRIQADAQNAMNDGLRQGKAGFTGALVAIEPSTGLVKAMVAGPGFEHSQYNIATSSIGRQAGSTWKVITLAAALESGFSPSDMVEGTSPCMFKVYGRTQNAEGGGGQMTLRAATAHSVNCAFARTELAVGFNKVIDTAYKMGIVQKTLKPILTLTLGAIETAPLEMATVAATIASGGIHHQPLFVSKIVAPDGEVVFDAKDVPGQRAISADAAACETNLLQGVISGGTGTNAHLNGRPVAGKTGTTDNKADANFLGFTPQLATFIWHGSPVGRIPGAGFGGNIPAGIFRNFMNAALAGSPVLQFPPQGPDCARPSAFITEFGRVSTLNGLLPGQAATIPPTVIINPTTSSVPVTTPTTPTTLPTTTSPTT
jgi:penicillin-binding protein 1A